MSPHKLYSRPTMENSHLDSGTRLALAYQKGDISVAHALVEQYSDMVWDIARKIPLYGSYTLDDSFQEGAAAICPAAMKFDITRGTRFSTFVHMKIKGAIQRAIKDAARMIRFSYGREDLISKYSGVKSKLTLLTGREPSVDELAEAMEVSVSTVKELQGILTGCVNIESLDVNFVDSSSNLHEILPDTEDVSPLDKVISSSSVAVLREALSQLDPRDRRLINMRHGLRGRQPVGLVKTGRRFGVSKTMIANLQNLAETELRRTMIRNGFHGLDR